MDIKDKVIQPEYGKVARYKRIGKNLDSGNLTEKIGAALKDLGEDKFSWGIQVLVYQEGEGNIL